MRPQSSRLIAAGDEVVSDASGGGRFEHEFKQEQAELATGPHTSLADLADELRLRRRELAASATKNGARLLALATSPLDAHVSSTPDSRYEQMNTTFGHVARVQLTCGMHVHVDVSSREEGVAVIDRLRPWLPVLIALSANSPYLVGTDTGYASYRTVLWGQWPTAGMTEAFGTVEVYDEVADALLRTGAALDERMLYYGARLSSRYPTVEIRVADVCPLACDAVLIAALARALVTTLADDRTVPCRTEVLRAATWRAARWGMESSLYDVTAGEVVESWELVDRLVKKVEPALVDVGDEAIVRDGLASIRSQGTGAAAQRAAYLEHGSFEAVVDAIARRTLA